MTTTRLQDFIPRLADFPDIHFGDTVDLTEINGSAIPFKATVLPGGPQGGRTYLRFEVPFSPQLRARLQANADSPVGGLAFQFAFRRLGGYLNLTSPHVTLSIIQRDSGAAALSEDGKRLEFVVITSP